MNASFHLIDLGVVCIANLTNLLLAAMFLLRGAGRRQAGFRVGLVSLCLGVPLAAALAFNLLAARPWWTTVLPGLLVYYDAVELVVDYLLKLDFRHSRWLGPYLALFYLAVMGMIGYAFAVGKPEGFVTLVTYFICLGATAYAHRGGRKDVE